MKALVLVPLLCASCAVHYGESVTHPDGTTTSKYFWADFGRDADAIAVGPGTASVIGQNETRGMAEVTRSVIGWKTLDVLEKTTLGEQATDQTAIKEGAATDRAGIEAGTQAVKETETTKRVLGTFVPGQ